MSIAAEIVAHRWGGTGRRLTDTAGPIHTDAGAPDPAPMPRPMSDGRRARARRRRGPAASVGRRRWSSSTASGSSTARCGSCATAGSAGRTSSAAPSSSTWPVPPSSPTRNGPPAWVRPCAPAWPAMAVDVEAALVVLVDQVGLTPTAVRRVLAAGAGPARLATATYDGRRGHPVLIGRAHWREVVATAVGEVGAREVLAVHADEVVTVECGDVRAMPTSTARGPPDPLAASHLCIISGEGVGGFSVVRPGCRRGVSASWTTATTTRAPKGIAKLSVASRTAPKRNGPVDASE